MNRKIRRAQEREQWFKAQWLTSTRFLRMPQYENVYACGVRVQARLLDMWLKNRNLWA